MCKLFLTDQIFTLGRFVCLKPSPPINTITGNNCSLVVSEQYWITQRKLTTIIRNRLL